MEKQNTGTKKPFDHKQLELVSIENMVLETNIYYKNRKILRRASPIGFVQKMFSSPKKKHKMLLKSLAEKKPYKKKHKGGLRR